MGRKSELTKARIAAALEALLEHQPLSQITVSAVVREAGTNRQTFYYHFGALDDLVFYLCQQKVSSLSQEVKSCDDLDALFFALVSQVEENRTIFKKVLNGVGRPALREVFHDDAKEALFAHARAMVAARGGQGTDDDLDFVAEYCLLATASVLVAWIDGSVSFTARQLTDRLVRAFEQQIEGLLAGA